MFSQSSLSSKSKDDLNQNQTSKINAAQMNNDVVTKTKVKTTFENFLSKIINRKRNFNYFKSHKRKQDASNNCAHDSNTDSGCNSNQQSIRRISESSSCLDDEKVQTNGQIKRMKIQENETVEVQPLDKAIFTRKEPNFSASTSSSKADINIDLLLNEPSSILLPLLKELMTNQNDYSNMNEQSEQDNREQCENTRFKSKFFQDLISNINNSTDYGQQQSESATSSPIDLFETNEITEIKKNSILKTLIESFPNLIEKLDLDEFENSSTIDSQTMDDCNSSTIIHNISDCEEENFHYQESDQSVIVKETEQTFLNHSLNQQQTEDV